MPLYAVEHAEATFDRVFSDISIEDARQLSNSSRSEDALSGNGDFTYGEINFRSFASVLRDVHTTPGSRMLDLGAGIGKPVIAAALLFDFQACVGIEQLRGLYKVACSRPKRLLRVLQAQGGLPEDLPDMEFSNTSFFDTSWRDYDVVFMSSTTFVPATLAAVAAKARELPHGAVLISLTHPLQAPHLLEQSRRTVEMSWGAVVVIVHRRVPTGQPRPIPPSYAAALSDTESDGAGRGGGGTGHALPVAPPARGMRVRVPSYASSDSMGLFDIDREPPSEVNVMADISESGGSNGVSKPPLPPHAQAGGRALLKKSFSMSSQGTYALDGVDDRVSPPSTPSRSRSNSDTGSPHAASSAAPFGSPAGARHARVTDELGGASSPQAAGLLQRRHAKRAGAQGSRLGGGLRNMYADAAPRVSPLFAPTGGVMGMPPFHMGGGPEEGARGLSSPMDRSLRQRNSQRQAAGPLRDRMDSSGSAEGPLHKTYVTPPKPASSAAAGQNEAVSNPNASSPQGTRLLQQRAARQAAMPRGSLLQHSSGTPSRTTYSESTGTPPHPTSLSVPAAEEGARGLSSPMDRSLRQRNSQRQVAGPLRDRIDSSASLSSAESAGGVTWQGHPQAPSDTAADLREDVSSPFGARLRRSRGGAPPPSRALGDPLAGGSASPLTGAAVAPALPAHGQQPYVPLREMGGVQGGASSPMGRSLLQARNAGSMPRGGPLQQQMREGGASASPLQGAVTLSSPPPQVRLSQHNKYLQSVMGQAFEGSASPQGDALLRRRQMAHTVRAAAPPASVPLTGPLFSKSHSGSSTPASNGFVSDAPESEHAAGHTSAFAVSPAGSPTAADAGDALPRNVSAFAVDEDSPAGAAHGLYSAGYPSSRNDTTLSMDEEADIVTSLGAGSGAQLRVGLRTRYSDADIGLLEGSL